MLMSVDVNATPYCGGQRTTGGSWFSPLTMWVLGWTQIMSTFPCWVYSPILLTDWAPPLSALIPSDLFWFNLMLFSWRCLLYNLLQIRHCKKRLYFNLKFAKGDVFAIWNLSEKFELRTNHELERTQKHKRPSYPTLEQQALFIEVKGCTELAWLVQLRPLPCRDMVWSVRSSRLAEAWLLMVGRDWAAVGLQSYIWVVGLQLLTSEHGSSLLTMHFTR